MRWNNTKKLFFIFSVFGIIALAAYGTREMPEEVLPEPVTKEIAAEKIAVREPLMHVFSFSSTGTIATVEYREDPDFVSAWTDGSSEEIVMNGGYFHEDYSPSGFLVANGARIGSRMFDQDKSGLLVIKDGRVSIRDVGKFPVKKGETFDGALQSYPFLIKNSRPGVREDSGKKARRTAIGTDADGMIYLLVVSSREISLFEFMNELIATGIPFTSVLNLDGGPSTGIMADWAGQIVSYDSLVPVPSVLRFKKIE